ncbi:MAG: hypothetical protein JSV44_12695 [Candidatus Zixiibacteriota bacterium]|nr:MAG: hypothetical protein JSV44_12695 [candidate division Zixibacteria bacterium]
MESYITDLFKYLDTYEKNYARFDTEAFFQTYNGICAVFQALREQRDKAVQVDQFFLRKIKQAPLNSSDLRQLCIQILITYFESEADTDGQSNQAYLYCRGLRAAKQDVPFFEHNLIPLLFRDGALNNNYELNAFLLSEIGRYINKFGRSINSALPPEDFDRMETPLKFLELSRRRLVLGEDLMRDHGSLEFHLQRVRAFDKLAKSSKLVEFYLTRWQYLARTSFWSKVAAFFGELGGKAKGVLSNWRYFRLVMTQRNPAYFLYSLLIILFILLAIYVPMKWNSYTETRLERFEKRAITTQQPGGR